MDENQALLEPENSQPEEEGLESLLQDTETDPAGDDEGGFAPRYEYDEDGNAIEVETEDPDAVEAEPTQVEAQAEYRPTPTYRNAEEAETVARGLLGDEGFAAVMAVIEARNQNARQGETISDFYAQQVSNAAPGFITPEVRAEASRLFTPQQLADPATTALMAFSSAMRKSTKTGNVLAAIDEWVDQWQTTRGRAKPKAAATPAPVIPPTQRVAGGNSGGGVIRPAATAARRGNVNAAAEFIKQFGYNEKDAARLARLDG